MVMYGKQSCEIYAEFQVLNLLPDIDSSMLVKEYELHIFMKFSTVH
jgi:hypothetical protein